MKQQRLPYYDRVYLYIHRLNGEFSKVCWMTLKIQWSAYTYVCTIYIDGDFGVSVKWMDWNNWNFDYCLDLPFILSWQLNDVLENPL